jgi:hypothetical protein
MISPWKWLFASLAGVLIAASIVWVARVAMGYGPNPTNLWRNASMQPREPETARRRTTDAKDRRQGRQFCFRSDAGPQRI